MEEYLVGLKKLRNEATFFSIFYAVCAVLGFLFFSDLAFLIYIFLGASICYSIGFFWLNTRIRNIEKKIAKYQEQIRKHERAISNRD